MSRWAALRCCASCEWIFTGGVECPKCKFGSYGARYVYGNNAYKFAKTQTPWRNKKLADFKVELDREIRTQNKTRVRAKKNLKNKGYICTTNLISHFEL